MKFLLTIFLLSFAFGGSGQDLTWSWETSSTKVSDNTYHILVKGKIPKGWHVYAQNDADDGLDALLIGWDNEEILKAESLLCDVSPKIITDRLFSKKLKVWDGEISLLQAIEIKGTIPATIRISIRGFASNNSEFLPIDVTKEVALEGGIVTEQRIKLSSINLENPVANCGDKSQKDKSVWGIFLLGMAGGLIALLTPCVFPMIPVTVSFFTNRAKTKREGIRNGILYGFFIFLIYLLASSPFHLLDNIQPEIFNAISTNAWVNVFFFAVFIFFALSFFGLFEIRLPASISNSAGAKSGIFFMALTLVVVSFSCTGVILGSLLVSSLSSNGGAWQLTAGMGGFGAALALPFGLFAMFPQWMKRIPKSGGWMDVLKKSLAFVELALAIKFLSNADLVQHWGILKREVFIGLWILIAVALALYLLGAFSKRNYVLPLLHNADASPNPGFQSRISWPRKAIGLTVFLFALYLVPGVTRTKYANLKLLSGFPPPLSYSIYGTNNVHGKGLEPDVINDYDKALALSKQSGKPLLIDFTGWACVNCRKMEEHVWTKPEISQLIKDKYILVSLYVDDRTRLPAEQRFTYKNAMGEEKDIVTIGDKYATFQADNFGQVTQPLYVILNPSEKLMNNPVGYTPDVEEYREWLECGLRAARR